MNGCWREYVYRCLSFYATWDLASNLFFTTVTFPGIRPPNSGNHVTRAARIVKPLPHDPAVSDNLLSN